MVTPVHGPRSTISKGARRTGKTEYYMVTITGAEKMERGSMRAEYTLALRRESEEFERALIEQRVDKAFEQVYEILGAATSHLRAILSKDDTRVLDQLEQGYLQAIEFASRSALGCQVTSRGDALREQRVGIPAAQIAQPTAHATDRATTIPDQVINVRPCG